MGVKKGRRRNATLCPLLFEEFGSTLKPDTNTPNSDTRFGST